MNPFRNLPIFRPLALAASASVGLLLVTMTACGGEEEQGPIPDFDYTIEVQATDLDDEPVAGVPVLLDDEVVGFTDASGVFQGVLQEQPDQVIRLSVDDVEGYRATDNDSLEQTLQVTRSLDGDYRGVPVTLRADFRSVLRENLTWIELECDDDLDDKYCRDLPISLDDEEIARTDEQGRAHFTFDSVPGEPHRVSIETPIHDPNADDSVRVEPANPVYDFELGADATIFHISEVFTDPDAEDEPAPRPRRRARPQPQSEPEPEPEPEPEEEQRRGPIDLF